MSRRPNSQVNVTLIHYIFTPKYRRELFTAREVAAAVQSSMEYIATKHGIRIHAIAVMDDHVHVFAQLPVGMTVEKGAFFLKWFSSLRVRAMFPRIKQAIPKHMWGHRFYSATVGAGKHTVREYIEKQMRERNNDG